MASAVVVWFAGSRLAGFVDEISDRTGLGEGLAGLFLLGGITSLPEIAVSVTASLGGEAALAVNNVLGSVAAQVAILAIADALIGREALTSVVVRPTVLLQAALNILLLTFVAMAVTTGDVALGPVGLWSCFLLLAYLGSMWLLSRYEGRDTWTPAPHAEGARGEDEGEKGSTDGEQKGSDERRPMSSLVLLTLLCAAAILVAGTLLSETGEAIAKKSGLGSAFFGATLLALATSLPEISTMVAAVRLRRYEMALGDIFGTNLFNAALLFLVDAVAPGEPVLGRVGPFAAFGSLLGLVLTAVFLAGVVERRDRTVLGMGWDSLASLVLYAAGVGVLYVLRGSAGGG
ncbi:sodium:calcium antiporter [Roseomonas sp. SSH11]|uniref:Sodium:calcium antiporter n=2 Tax=Pararoseomonas baculiformis TaxID=2820812 RepID=A0ABS4AKH5_9PROT|nr:sodium:calcium antiporter [Pararoseomonas baculiformis]MBP0447547.1 sodium:calcium antiporter [Pararoseomonas baculiformis]